MSVHIDCVADKMASQKGLSNRDSDCASSSVPEFQPDPRGSDQFESTVSGLNIIIQLL